MTARPLPTTRASAGIATVETPDAAAGTSLPAADSLPPRAGDAEGSAAPARQGRGGRPLPVRRGRHLPTALYGALVVTVFAGIVGLSAAAGVWQTSGRTTAGGASVTLQGTSTTEIKGWMTVGDVADAFGVPLPDLLAAFGLDPATPSSTAVKDLESDLFSVVALRDWIDLQRGPVP